MICGHVLGPWRSRREERREQRRGHHQVDNGRNRHEEVVVDGGVACMCVVDGRVVLGTSPSEVLRISIGLHSCSGRGSACASGSVSGDQES